MSEEIVACPGCSKKFRIPEGAPPGSFPCTACNAEVPYGAAPAQKPAARVAAPARAAAAAAPQRPAASRAPARAASRREEYDDEPRGRRGRAPEPAPKKGGQGLLWGGIAAAGAALIFFAWYATRPTTPTAPPTTPTNTAAAPKPQDQPAKPSATSPAPSNSTSPAKPADTPKTDTTPAPPPPMPSKAPDTPAKAGEPAKPPVEAPLPPPPPIKRMTITVATLGTAVENVPGTTPAERDQMDKWVAMVADRDAGNEASNAESKLKGMGKKALPPLLSVFSKQYSGAKWGNENEQWAAERVQDLLHRIVPFDGAPSELVRFNPGDLTPPADFERVVRKWFDWWNNTGQTKEKFRKNNDEPPIK